MRFLIALSFFALSLCSGGAVADGEDDADRDVRSDSAIAINVSGSDLLQLPDSAATGNPFKSLVKNWPEDLVIVPIPGYSPELGWMLTLGGGYFLKAHDEATKEKPSTIGVFGMLSENDSYAYGAGGNLHFLEDRIRVKAGGGYVNINYRFYGVGNEAGEQGISVDVNQEMPLFYVSATYRVWSKFYAGIGYVRGESTTRLRLDLPLPPDLPDPSLKFELGAYEIPLEFDSRDHEQFPRSGWHVKSRNLFYRDSAGSSFDAETYALAINHYRPVRDGDVLAFRGFFRSSSGNAPFFLLSTFGGRTDLRGYDAGRYRDKLMYALQGEYRWQFNDRWIFTGFAGVGEVAPSLDKMGRNLLPATGIGVRFVLSQKHRVSLSADIGVGKNGAQFYFGVGEAF